MNITHGNLRIAIEMTEDLLLQEGKLVETSSWQGFSKDDGSLDTYEIINCSFTVPVPPYLIDLQDLIKPNLPWADKHFEERVSRLPYNPPPSHKEWPFWRESSEATKETPDGKFSHSYPERFWPKGAGVPFYHIFGLPRMGIRYEYGDLDDVINLLARDPYTRQANFPIYFPEDTGSKYQGRVPCSLNYFFLLRDGQLNIFYEIRSCDLLRHFKDDVYFSCRLLHWVLEELRRKGKDKDSWSKITPGTLTFHSYSLHMFLADKDILAYKIKNRARGMKR